MPAPVVVEFLLKGMPDVARAIRTVQQATEAADKARTSSAARTSTQRTRAEENEAKAKIRAMLKADREVQRIQEKSVRDTEKTAKAKVREQEKAAHAETRTAEKAANEKLRAERAVDRELRRMERARARDNERILRESAREQEKIHRQQTRMLADRAKAEERFARGTANRFMGAGRAGINTAGRIAGTFAQLGGGFSLADSAEREVGLHREAGKISASTVGNNRLTTQEIVNNARATGLAQGFDPKEILEGVDKFKNLTGDTGRAMRMMPKIAQMANAVGGDVGSLADNAANIALADPKMNDADVLRMLRIQARQGAVGAVELPDFAKYGSRITAGAGLFEGDRGRNIAQLSAFSQIARQRGGAATAAEATLAAQRFATDVASKSDVLAGMGIDVKGKDGKLKEANDILKQMVKATGGDVTKFKGTGLGERGVKVLTAASDIYSAAGGGEAGMKALDEELKKFTDGLSDADIEMRAKERLQDADKQLEMAMIELRSAVGKELLPEFIKMVPVLREYMPVIRGLLTGFTKLADIAIRNPLAGLGMLIGAAFAKELALAGIGKVVERVIGSSLGSKGLAVGSAIMTIAMAKMMIEQEFKAEADAQKDTIGRQNEARNLLTKINRGEATEEDIAKAQGLISGLKKDRQQQEELRDDPGFWKSASGAMTELIDPEAFKEAVHKENEERARTIKAQAEMTQKLIDALDRNAAAKSKGDGASPPAGGGGGKPASASTGVVQRAVR